MEQQGEGLAADLPIVPPLKSIRLSSCHGQGDKPWRTSSFAFHAILNFR